MYKTITALFPTHFVCQCYFSKKHQEQRLIFAFSKNKITTSRFNTKVEHHLNAFHETKFASVFFPIIEWVTKLHLPESTSFSSTTRNRADKPIEKSIKETDRYLNNRHFRKKRTDAINHEPICYKFRRKSGEIYTIVNSLPIMRKNFLNASFWSHWKRNSWYSKKIFDHHFNVCFENTWSKFFESYNRSDPRVFQKGSFPWSNGNLWSFFKGVDETEPSC